MSYKGSGRFCSVFGCNSSTKKRSIWANTLCKEHQLMHKDCPCLVPFSLHCFPRDSDLRRQWISAVNRKDFVPKKYSVVCSLHFTDGRPTENNPVPQKNLGYNKKIINGRQCPRRRNNAVMNSNQLDQEITEVEDNTLCCSSETSSAVVVSPTYCTLGTQWEDPTKPIQANPS